MMPYSSQFGCIATLWIFVLLPQLVAKAEPKECLPIRCRNHDESQTCNAIQCNHETDDCRYSFSWCEFNLQKPNNWVWCKNTLVQATNNRCNFLIYNCSCSQSGTSNITCYDCLLYPLLTGMFSSRVDTEKSTSVHFQSLMTTSSLTPAKSMIRPSLYLQTITPSTHPVTSSNAVVPVVAGVLAVCLLLLALLIVIGSILAFTLYRKTQHNTERHQINTQGQLSTRQRMENIYYAQPPAQSTDGVYSLAREGDPNTTETSHHNTVLPPPTYSSLATTQLQDVNEQGPPPDYSVITQSNISYGVVQSRNTVAPAGVGAGTVYSTVVRQDGKKVTVKMETSHTHTEEEEEPGVQTTFNHDHTSSVEFTNSTSHVTEEEEGAQDYFDDPDILQQIRAQK